MYKAKYYFIICCIINLIATKNCHSQNFIRIDDNMLFCYEGNLDFIMLKINDRKDILKFTYPSDICEFIHSKTKLPSDQKESFVMNVNGINKELSVTESYWSCLPNGYYLTNLNKKKICIIEFSLVSHIGKTGYNYMIINYTDMNKIIVKELSSLNKVMITTLISDR